MPRRQIKDSTDIEISGPRVALRPFRQADIAIVEPWYGAAAAAVGGLPPEHAPSIQRPKSVGRGPSLDRGRPRALPYGVVPSIPDLSYQLEEAETDPDRGLLAFTLTQTLSLRARGQGEGEGTPIGLLDYRLNRPAPGWCTVGFIAIEPARRGYGPGSEAVRAFEDAMRQRGLARHFRADVSPDNGLAFYFWLRLGYRPAAASEPAGVLAARDIIWMIRS